MYFCLRQRKVNKAKEVYRSSKVLKCLQTKNPGKHDNRRRKQKNRKDTEVQQDRCQSCYFQTKFSIK